VHPVGIDETFQSIPSSVPRTSLTLFLSLWFHLLSWILRISCVIVELEARENAALQKTAKEKFVKDQQTKDAAKQLEQEVSLHYSFFLASCAMTYSILFYSMATSAMCLLVWRKGNINKNCLCVTLVCTIIMVHKDMSSSYRSVDCIGL